MPLPLWVSLGILIRRRRCTVLHHRSWANNGTRGPKHHSLTSFSFLFSHFFILVVFLRYLILYPFSAALFGKEKNIYMYKTLSCYFLCFCMFVCVFFAGMAVLSHPCDLLPIIFNQRQLREQGPEQEKPSCNFLLSLLYWQLYASVSARWALPFLLSHIPPAT